MNKLASLATKYGSDKWGHHYYCDIYENYLKELEKAPLVLLEIGIGGYSDTKAGGAGLKMWADYFSKGEIYGIDIFDKKFLNSGRIETFKGSQIDEDFLNRVVDGIGSPDIIIDDGSHINSHVIKSFEILFPRLKPGGWYFVEDCHTSYWDEIAADGTDFGGGNHSLTTMNYFKHLTDCVNYEHARGRIPIPDKPIEFIAFHKELIVIKKK